MTPAQARQASAELDLVRQRRELFFWTVSMTLALTVLLAMTVVFLLSLIQGATLDADRMMVGAGITGTSAAGGQALCLLRRFGGTRPPA